MPRWLGGACWRWSGCVCVCVCVCAAALSTVGKLRAHCQSALARPSAPSSAPSAPGAMGRTATAGRVRVGHGGVCLSIPPGHLSWVVPSPGLAQMPLPFPGLQGSSPAWGLSQGLTSLSHQEAETGVRFSLQAMTVTIPSSANWQPSPDQQPQERDARSPPSSQYTASTAQCSTYREGSTTESQPASPWVDRLELAAPTREALLLGPGPLFRALFFHVAIGPL